MKLPKQYQPIERRVLVEHIQWGGLRPAQTRPGCLTTRRGSATIIANPCGPVSTPDHTLFRMLASGCSCISPNCVAVSCPAECVEDGVGFVC
jgi:hypothetical protein